MGNKDHGEETASDGERGAGALRGTEKQALGKSLPGVKKSESRPALVSIAGRAVSLTFPLFVKRSARVECYLLSGRETGALLIPLNALTRRRPSPTSRNPAYRKNVCLGATGNYIRYRKAS